jgi:hypothetical protein
VLVRSVAGQMYHCKGEIFLAICFSFFFASKKKNNNKHQEGGKKERKEVVCLLLLFLLLLVLLTLVNNDIKSSSNILNIQEVSRITTRSMQRNSLPSHKLIHKLRNELLGVLMRPVDVVSTSDNAWKLEGTEVGFD